MLSLLLARKSLQVMAERSTTCARAGAVSSKAASRAAPKVFIRASSAMVRADATGGEAARQSTQSRVPVRSDRARDALECALDELGNEQPRRIDRPRHGGATERNPLEPVRSVIGLVADQH